MTNIHRIIVCDPIMCGYFCTGFIDFMLQGNILLNYTNLCSPNDYEKNKKSVLKYFQQREKSEKEYVVLIMVSIENLQNMKYHNS